MRREIVFFVLGIVVGAVAVLLIRGGSSDAPESVSPELARGGDGSAPPRQKLEPTGETVPEESPAHPNAEKPAPPPPTVPELRQAILDGAERHEPIAEPLTALAAIGTAEALETILELFASPAFAKPEFFSVFAAALLPFDDARIGPLTVSLYRDWKAEETVGWRAMGPIASVLAKHGGPAGLAILEEQLTWASWGWRPAAIALRHGTTPRHLELGIETLRRRAHGDSDAELAGGYVESFGDEARRGLWGIAGDREAGIYARRVAITALVKTATPESIDRFLSLPVAGPDAELAVAAAYEFGRGKRALTDAQTAALRAVVATVIRTRDEKSLSHALYAIEYWPLYQTEELVALLEATVESETNPRWRKRMYAAIREARRDMIRAKAR